MTNDENTYQLSPLAQKIRERRKQMKWTQDDLARQVDSNASYISRVETDTTGYPIEPDLIARIETALQFPSGDLMAHETWMGRPLIRKQVDAQVGEFAREIRKLRDNEGWSQQQLATEMGLNASMISKLESDSAGVPSFNIAVKLQQAFRISDQRFEILAAKMMREKNLQEDVEKNGPAAVTSVVETLRSVGQQNQVDPEVLKILEKAQKEMEAFYNKKK